MSADSISECPRCTEEELREWYEYELTEDSFFFSYFAKCRGCDFEFARQHEERLGDRPAPSVFIGGKPVSPHERVKLAPVDSGEGDRPAETREHDWQEWWDGALGYRQTWRCTRCSEYRVTDPTHSGEGDRG